MAKKRPPKAGQSGGTRLNELIIAAVANAIDLGHGKPTAAAAAGVGRRSLYRWLEKGQKLADQIDELPDDDAVDRFEQSLSPRDTLMVQLLRAVEKAEADFISRNLAVITKVATKDDKENWQAAMALLERCHPERFARRQYYDTPPTEDENRPTMAAMMAQMFASTGAPPDNQAE